MISPVRREMKLVIKLRKGNTANLSEKFLAREKRHNNYQLGVAVILRMKKTWKKALPEERRPGASLQIGIVRLLSGGIHLKDAVKHLIRGEGGVHVEKGGFLVKGNLQKGSEEEITGRAHREIQEVRYLVVSSWSASSIANVKRFNKFKNFNVYKRICKNNKTNIPKKSEESD